jgi:hypothetical protein
MICIIYIIHIHDIQSTYTLEIQVINVRIRNKLNRNNINEGKKNVGRIALTLVTVTISTCSACGPNEDRVLKLIMKFLLLLLMMMMMMTIKMKSTELNYNIYSIRKTCPSKKKNKVN